MISSTLLRGFTISRDLSQRTGRATLIIFARPADVTIASSLTGSLFGEVGFGSTIFGGPTSPSPAILLPQATVEIWDGSGPATSGVLFGEPTFGESPFGGSTAGQLRFAGTISRITPRALTLANNGLGYTEYTLECQDYTALLDTAVPPAVTLPSGFSDQSAIRYIIDNTLPGIIDTTDVDSITVLDAMALSGVTARQALENICQLSGGNFWVDQNKALHYHSPSATPAPFAISDTPDYATTFPGLFADYQYSQDFSNPGNRITVFGGGDTPPSIEVNDATSQSTYGKVFSRVLRDQSLLTIAAVTARANVELARYKQPLQTGRFTTRYEGLDVGQLVPVTNQALGISGTFLIRRLTMTWPTSTETRFGVEFGDLNADLIRLLRSFNSLTAKQPTFNSTVVEYNADDTFVVPATVNKITVECWGPGGFGNAGQAVGGNGGGGGGGGVYARSDLTVIPGASYAVTVPAGATELPTWFGTIDTIKAAAGLNGGHGDIGGPGGLGGQTSDSIGTTTTSGADGATQATGHGGNGGSGAGSGGGAGGAGAAITANGFTGSAPGGGGGGGGNSGGSGGNGAPGKVKITYSVG